MSESEPDGVKRSAVVFGRITDESTGEPIAGAAVRSCAAGFGRAFPEVETHSDQDGRYELSVTWSGDQQAPLLHEVWSDGYAYCGAPVMDPKAESGRRKVLTDGERFELSPALSEGFALEITVEDAEGKPLAGATASAKLVIRDEEFVIDAARSRVPGHNACLTSDAHGRIVLRGFSAKPTDDERYALLIRHRDYVDHIEENLQLLPRKDRVAKMTVRLKRGLTLTGRVTGRKTDAGVEGARVGVVPVAKRLTFDCCGSIGKEVATGAAGRYELPGLQAGAHHMVVLHPEWRTVFGKKIDVDGRAPVDIELDRRAVITGMVLDANGSPVVGAEVTVIGKNPQRGFERADTDAEGQFSLPCPTRRGWVHVTAYDRTRSYGYRKVRARDQKIVLDAREHVTLTGQVIDAQSGQPVAEALYWRASVAGLYGTVVGTSSTREKGGRLVVDLPPEGTFTLAVTAADAFYDSPFYAFKKVVIMRGKPPELIALVARPPQKMTVRVVDAADGKPVLRAVVEAQPALGEWNIFYTRGAGEDGCWTLDNLPPFGMTVKARAKGYRSTRWRKIPPGRIAARPVVIKLKRLKQPSP